MKYTWKTYKDKTTGYTMIEVSDGTNSIVSSHRPYAVRNMTEKDFNRIIEILKRGMEITYG